MTPNNDFLDNLANNQHQKMLREIANDDYTPKSEKFKKQNEIHEKIRNDDDYDDWEYGTEPDIGKRDETLAAVDPLSPENVDQLHEEITQRYRNIPKRY